MLKILCLIIDSFSVKKRAQTIYYIVNYNNKTYRNNNFNFLFRVILIVIIAGLNQ